MLVTLTHRQQSHYNHKYFSNTVSVFLNKTERRQDKFTSVTKVENASHGRSEINQQKNLCLYQLLMTKD